MLLFLGKFKKKYCFGGQIQHVMLAEPSVGLSPWVIGVRTVHKHSFSHPCRHVVEFHFLTLSEVRQGV